jgi:Mn-dependent DtxR family transcriptional regulator
MCDEKRYSAEQPWISDQLEIFLECVQDGLESCSEIAAEMKVSKGTVSKLAKKAAAAGLIIIRGRRYLVPGSADLENNFE